MDTLVTRKVNQGDPLEIPAQNYNAFVEAATWVREAQRRGGEIAGGSRSRVLLVTVKNDSGQDLDRFAAVGIADSVTHPADNENEFKNRVALKIRKPEALDTDRWFVLPAPMRKDEIGVAIAIGVCPCKINLKSIGDLAVAVETGNTIPVSGSSGAQILWVDGGAGSAKATGEQWAVIRIGGGSGGSVPVGEFTFMTFQVGAQTVDVFDFERLHPMVFL